MIQYNMIEIDKITLKELKQLASEMYGDMVKGVVDIKKEKLVLQSELHVDQEKYLLENGSEQQNLWGINLYPDDFGTDNFVEYDSIINIRPRQENMSRFVEDENIRKHIEQIINGKIYSNS